MPILQSELLNRAIETKALYDLFEDMSELSQEDYNGMIEESAVIDFACEVLKRGVLLNEKLLDYTTLRIEQAFIYYNETRHIAA